MEDRSRIRGLQLNSTDAYHCDGLPLPDEKPVSIDFRAARYATFQSVNRNVYDVAIIGAGISGSRIFYQLSQRGYRVLLLDKGDFACGTSQASGMMIWGGLLYLKDFDFATVRKLSKARDEWIEQAPAKVEVANLLYLQRKTPLRSRHLVHAGLLLYWLMGSMKRRFPAMKSNIADLDFLKLGHFRHGLSFDEAVLKDSDTRFVLEWISSSISSQAVALNHCAADHMTFDRSTKTWRLDLRDRLHGHEVTASARLIVNAAGVWTDKVNEMLAVESPYRHELSKGVYISVPRPKSLRQILVFDTEKNADTFTVSPWGPVALCGPTESRVTGIHEGFSPSPLDARSLLQNSNANLKVSYRAEDIVSLRCGIRPLAVRNGFSKIVHPLELSRRHLIYHDRARNVISVYGGKLTSCGLMAQQVSALVAPHLMAGPESIQCVSEPTPMEYFPGLNEPIPSAAWCRDHEWCWTLEDYLRRRTNIAQWIPRGGLGHDGENIEAIRRISRIFSPDQVTAEAALQTYQKFVRDRHDDILAAI